MKRVRNKTAMVCASVLSLSILAPSPMTQAAGDDIRVALFIDIGTGYRGTVPAVTLTSESGFEMKLIGADGRESLPDSEETTARFRTDEFQLAVIHTADLALAQKTAQTLTQQRYEAVIQAEEKGGRMMYTVMTGSANTYEQATTLSKQVAAKTGTQPKITGPLHLEAGTYDSWKEAKEWEERLEQAGLSADTVYIQDGDDLGYAVWIGSEVSDAARDKLQDQAKELFPQVKFRAPRADSYVILRQVTANTGKVNLINQYMISPQAKLQVTPGDDARVPLIGVTERSGRRYRGMIELFEHKGFLTVVNELSMEEYLYGVVGSEMATGWPLEALKTQAVLARTRAVGQGNKYGVANLSDTVYEQAYYGYDKEAADIRRAVDATEGEVIWYRGKVAESLFYSNAGGMTADGKEVWGNSVAYLEAVPSPDEYPLNTAKTWYRVALADGTIGYVRSDYVTVKSGRNAIGLEQGTINTSNLNLRSGPSTTIHKTLRTAPNGTQVTILHKEPEENPFVWSRGPYTAQEMTKMINDAQAKNKGNKITGTLQSLEVTKRGESGRVLQMEADGTVIKVSSPDAHRSVFVQGDQSLRSTKFIVEEMGTYSVLGADGKVVNYPAESRDLKAVGSSSGTAATVNGSSEEFLILDGSNNLRVASKEQKFILRGNGFGHGLGVSQYGARQMAEQGYDYKDILQHYYQDVTIEEE
ncbi:SpoIID/LytB domain-containing protein [Brevibacillus dissolubilis]|uniref:SpoIID/LytB domain-containing protein n=1 Tax=Brevibacillus dissolubilis TaxID=1844116 RepID=UPI0020FFF5D2|nr:SpoIID/LytB domain-containing protein [Brevibacillus dissolubilis]